MYIRFHSWFVIKVIGILRFIFISVSQLNYVLAHLISFVNHVLSTFNLNVNSKYNMIVK